jgi:hypothetical protein
MREMLRFAAQSVLRTMDDGEGLLRDGFETVSGVLGSCLDWPRTVTAASRRRFAKLTWLVFEGSLARKLRFSHLQLSVFEGSLAAPRRCGPRVTQNSCLPQKKCCSGMLGTGTEMRDNDR